MLDCLCLASCFRSGVDLLAAGRVLPQPPSCQRRSVILVIGGLSRLARHAPLRSPELTAALANSFFGTTALVAAQSAWCLGALHCRLVAEATFKQAIALGQVESAAAVARAIRELRPHFPPGSYNVVTKNCKPVLT